MKVGRLRTGVIFILIGVVLLLNTTGALNVDVWESILKLWPLLLIAIGIEKIFTSTERFQPLAYLSPVIIAGTVIYAIFATPNGNLWADYDRDDTRGPYRWSVAAVDDIQDVRIDCDFGGGRLAIRGGAGPGKALDGQFYYQTHEPELTYDSRDGSMVINLRRDGSSGPGILSRSRERERWIIKLTEELPVDLNVAAGAAKVRLDLKDLICRRIDLSSGAADIDIVVGDRSPEIACRIDCAAGSVDMGVPAGAGIRLDRSSALSQLSTGDLELREVNGYLESPEFESRPVRIIISIDAALSSLRLHETRTRGIESSI
ncbi:MAG: DUF5668 domain-containing protein [Candidatus Zixiibacteriota bacterium]